MRHFYLATAACLSLFAAQVQAADKKTADTYETAYKSMQETGKPLVVLIGADWCPACQTMKTSVMPKLQSNGKLKDVAFATVNTDHQDRVARAMMEGNLIPQLVIYTKTKDGWKLERLIGGQSAEAVEKFLSKSTATEAKITTVGQRNKPIEN